MKSTQIYFRLEVELKRQLEAVCFALETDRSEFIRKAIRQKIREQARSNPRVMQVLEIYNDEREQMRNNDHDHF